jgi:hypothetical protein
VQDGREGPVRIVRVEIIHPNAVADTSLLQRSAATFLTQFGPLFRCLWSTNLKEDRSYISQPRILSGDKSGGIRCRRTDLWRFDYDAKRRLSFSSLRGGPEVTPADRRTDGLCSTYSFLRRREPRRHAAPVSRRHSEKGITAAHRGRKRPTRRPRRFAVNSIEASTGAGNEMHFDAVPPGCASLCHSEKSCRDRSGSGRAHCSSRWHRFHCPAVAVTCVSW